MRYEPAEVRDEPAEFPGVVRAVPHTPSVRLWAEIALDDVNLTSGDRVLDIACGTGIVAHVAKERLGNTGRIAGIDV